MKKKQKTEEEILEVTGGLIKMQQYHQALPILLESLKIFPNSAEINYNLGIIYSKTPETTSKAFSHYQEAIRLQPDSELPYINLAILLVRNKQLDESIHTLKTLLGKYPNSFLGQYNLGLVLVKKSLFSEAFYAFRRSIEINHEFIPAYFQIGLVLMETGRIEGAVDAFKEAISKRKDFVLGYMALGFAYEKLKRLKDAQEAFDQAAKINPNLTPMYDSQYSILKKLCLWEEAKKVKNLMHQETLKGLEGLDTRVEAPLINIMNDQDPEMNLKVASFASKIIEKEAKQANLGFKFNMKKANSRIKIGYLSPDFNEHPVTTQIIDLFKYHDKKLFDIYAYSYGAKNQSYWYQTIKKNARHFPDLQGLDHYQIAQKINQDGIDILIDLASYTGFQKPDILAFRPSPIQINYFGFSGSSGASYVDYIIADQIIIPKPDQTFYSEKMVYMPNCYQICTPIKISNDKFKKTNFSLPENSFVFCSYNRADKIEKDIFETWVRILKKVPNSILWLYVTEKDTQKNLQHHAQEYGLDPNRIVFAQKLPVKKHLNRLSLADLALDTYPFGGGVTTTNALWAGVPVITLKGNQYISRMSTSMLTNIGLPEFITHSLKEYENLALELATNPEKLKIVNLKLKINIKTYPLFNSKLFTENLEKAYLQIYQNYVSGHKPKHITIT